MLLKLRVEKTSSNEENYFTCLHSLLFASSLKQLCQRKGHTA